MKKRLLSLVLVGVMAATMLTACGSKETTTEAPVEEEVAVEETAETIEEPAEEVAEDTSDKDTTLGYVKEDMSEEEPEEANTEEFNQDVAMKKVERAIDCYRKLVETEDEATWNMIDSIERYEYKYYLDLTTSDGVPVYDPDSTALGYVAIAAMGNMYYDYTNEIINEVTPMSEYISSQTNDEIINKYNFDGKGNEDQTLMHSFMIVADYLNQAETIEAGDFIKLDTPVFVVNETMNAVYKMPLIVDGVDSRIFAVFDENGNMINTGNEDDVDWNVVSLYTFPEQ